MLPIWLDVILIWLVIGLLINMVKVAKGHYKWMLIKPPINQEKYEEGYKDAMMRYTEISNEHWKYSLEEPDLRSITNYYFKNNNYY